MRRVRFATALVALCASLMTAMPALAAPGGNGGNNNGNSGNGNNPPAVSATPELDSLALFGTGAAGMLSYALVRMRARKRPD